MVDMALQWTGSLTSWKAIVIYLKLGRFGIIVYCIYSSFVVVAVVFSNEKVLALNTATAAATQAGYGIGGRLAWQALGWFNEPGVHLIPEISTLGKIRQIPAAFQFGPIMDKLKFTCSALAVVLPHLVR